MPKIKSGFEMPSIDHTKQRMKLQNMLDHASQSMKEGNFPLSKITQNGGNGLGKKTMRLGGDGPLIKEGMFSPEAFMMGGTFSPTVDPSYASVIEEAKSLTTVKRGAMVRKKIVSSKTTREGRGMIQSEEGKGDPGDKQAILASETLEKLKKLVKK
jgi:hypothetical protein